MTIVQRMQSGASLRGTLMAKYSVTRRRPGISFLSRAFCHSLDVSKGPLNRLEGLVLSFGKPSG